MQKPPAFYNRKPPSPYFERDEDPVYFLKPIKFFIGAVAKTEWYLLVNTYLSLCPQRQAICYHGNKRFY